MGLSIQEKDKTDSCISDQNDLSYFRSTSHVNDSYQVSSQFAFPLRRRSEK